MVPHNINGSAFHGTIFFYFYGLPHTTPLSDMAGAKLIVQLSKLPEATQTMLDEMPLSSDVTVTGHVRKQQRRTYMDALHVTKGRKPSPGEVSLPEDSSDSSKRRTRRITWSDLETGKVH